MSSWTLKSPAFTILFFLFISNIIFAQSVKTIEFSGNHFLRKPEKLINFKPYSSYSDSITDVWKNIIISEYARQGYFWTSIMYETAKTKDGVKIRFRIQENPRAKISAIDILGNSNTPTTKLNSILQPYDYFSQNILNQEVQDLLGFYENNGYPFAAVEPQNFSLNDSAKTIRYSLKITEGSEIRISKVNFSGTQTKQSRMNSLFGLKPKAIYSESEIKRKLNRIAAQDFFVNDYRILTSDTNYILSITVKERKNQQISGAISYQPNNQELNGFFHLNLSNLFNTLRKINIGWERYGHYTDFSLNYLDPYLFGFALQGNLSQVVYDTFYAKTDISVGLNFPVFDNMTLNFSSGYDRTTPGTINLTGSETFWIGQGLTIENRDNPINANKGYWIDFITQLGSRAVARQNQILSKTNARLQFLLQLPYQTNFSLDLLANNLYSNHELSMSDSLFLGGTKTLRGYLENEFSTIRYLLARNEFNFLSSKTSHLFGFYDFAIFNKIGHYQFKSGYGIGLNTISKIGTVELDYGIPAASNILKGKIHLMFSTQF